MSDPDNRPLTDSDLKRMKRTPQDRIVRRALKLTREEFAPRAQIPIGAPRSSEQNRDEPDIKMDRFDLRARGWIPVRESSGTVREIGLEETMRRAHELRQIEGESPLETVSLYRLLVGLAHHLVGDFHSMREWREIGAKEKFDAGKVVQYFDQWADRFRLFDEALPFWQCPGLANTDPRTKAERPVPVASLVHSVASGNNKTLFSHQTDDGDFSLGAAEAARALVTAQYFSVGGLNKKSSNHFGGPQQSYYHAPFVPGMPCIIMGNTLFKTIILNMLPGEYRGSALGKMNLGAPPWAERREQIINLERVAAKNYTTTPRSYLDYLLPRSRHIRLLPENKMNGTVVVREIHIAQGVAWESKIEPWFVKIQDSHNPESRPLQLNLDRAVWRESAAYLGWRSRDQDKQQRHYIAPENLRAYGRYWSGSNRRKSLLAPVTIFALASDKAKSLAWRHETLDLPVEAMEDHAIMQGIQASLKNLERVAGILRGGVERYYREALRNDDSKKDAVPNKKAYSSAALRTYWGAVERPFRAVLVRESSWRDCSETCIREARGIFRNTMNAVVGSNLDLFSARAKAEAQFLGSLKKMEEELKRYTEEVQDGE